MKNICTMSDSYKMVHHNMYPKGTQNVYSYFEARPGATFDETVFVGLQPILERYLEGKVVTPNNINRAEAIVNAHLGPGKFNREGWEYILTKHKGYLPLRIKAVAEGTVVPINNVMMTVEATDEKCYWLTNYVETILTHVWYPSTVATLSRAAKKLFMEYAEKTAMSNDYVNFQLHDFGFRGVSSFESAEMGGMGHLVNFMGTDTVAAMELIMDYYNTEDVPAFSVPATEHSIATALGEEGEEILIQQLLDEYPTGILSLVIDSYDYRKFIKKCGTKFKEQILARDGKVVFRPDSGDPVKVSLEVMSLLKKYFGYTTNDKGFEVLNPKVGMLWGDGIDIGGIKQILESFYTATYSAENIVFGMGGGLLQKVNRDTQRFAFKCCSQKRVDRWIDVWKDPVDKSKASKRGRLRLIKKNGEILTVPENYHPASSDEDLVYDLLEVVFENGHTTQTPTFNLIRERAKV